MEVKLLMTYSEVFMISSSENKGEKKKSFYKY